MPSQAVQILRVMNAASVCLFIVCCLHLLAAHSKADTEGGALTVVPQDNDNGEVSVEVNHEGEAEVLSDEVFYPTNDWQTVKQGQAIPAGLHVRLNMETGEREAKLMEGDSGIKYWKAGDKQGMINTDKKHFNVDELKRALKDFKTTSLDEKDEQHEKEVKSKFRSYEELKKDLKEMNADIETEGEIITRLLDELRNKETNRDRLVYVLDEMEYLVHKSDNGLLLKDLGGISVILKIINSSVEEEVVAKAIKALGAAAYSNVPVQISSLEAGALQILLRQMSLSSSETIHSRALYATTAICKHFPYAQHRLLELGGLSAMLKVVKETKSDKVKVKAINYLTDWISEKDSLSDTANLHTSSVDMEKVKQYDKVAIREAVKEHGWCDVLPPLIDAAQADSWDRHDFREQVLTAVKILVNTCSSKLTHSRNTLQEIRSGYERLAKLEDDDDMDLYYTELLKVTEDIIYMIKVKEEL